MCIPITRIMIKSMWFSFSFSKIIIFIRKIMFEHWLFWFLDHSKLWCEISYFLNYLHCLPSLWMKDLVSEWQFLIQLRAHWSSSEVWGQVFDSIFHLPTSKEHKFSALHDKVCWEVSLPLSKLWYWYEGCQEWSLLVGLWRTQGLFLCFHLAPTVKDTKLFYFLL